MSAHRWTTICPPPRGLVRPVRVDPGGQRGPTRGQAAGPGWRRTSQGWYVPATLDGAVPEQRVMEQSVRVPAGGAVTGWGSLRLHRANFFDGLAPDRRTRIPVPLVVGARGNIRSDREATICRERLDAAEVVTAYGVACTRELRALFDEMRRVRDEREAVVAMDMTAAALLVSIRDLRDYSANRSHWRRARQVATALDLASERSKSPNETRMRLIWQLDAGLPRPLVNQHVWGSDGQLLGIADLLDPVAGVVGEFDGADHRGARRHSKDVDREGGFRNHRLEFFRVTGLDIPNRPLVVDRMRSTHARALWLPEGNRPWTIVPPPGWEREETLDEYLEHRAWLTSLFSQYEREGPPDLCAPTDYQRAVRYR